jgi:hypothetical protein
LGATSRRPRTSTALCVELGLLEEELNTKVNGFSWEDRLDNFTGPQAQAFHLLKKVDLGSAPDSN